jgi:hypothetical protein
VQHYAEIPKVMNTVPDYVKQLMKDIPVVWDETKFIDGFPGKYVVMARRQGSTWYIAGINGQNSEQALTINLAFTDQLLGILVTDGETNRSFQKTELNLSENKLIDITMGAQGGFVIQLLSHNKN